MRGYMSSKSGYHIIPAEEVQPGDISKFTPIDEDPPLFSQVLAVLLDRNMVQILRSDGEAPWTYIHPPAGVVIFGRQIG
jgi:hypothetical protein